MIPAPASDVCALPGFKKMMSFPDGGFAFSGGRAIDVGVASYLATAACAAATADWFDPSVVWCADVPAPGVWPSLELPESDEETLLEHAATSGKVAQTAAANLRKAVRLRDLRGLTEAVIYILPCAHE
jgi:hypothetical protein